MLGWLEAKFVLGGLGVSVLKLSGFVELRCDRLCRGLQNPRLSAVVLTGHVSDAAQEPSDLGLDEAMDETTGTPAAPDVEAEELETCTSPLHMALTMMMQALPVPLYYLLTQMLSVFAKTYPTVDHGSGCTGSDILVKVLEVIDVCILRPSGMDVKFRHVFAAEKDEEKQSFLMSQFPSLINLFSDVADLGKVQAKCLDRSPRL